MSTSSRGSELRSLWLGPAIIAADYVVAYTTNTLRIPFFLDSWGTSAGVILAGPIVGILGGVGYNLLMAATLWGWESWVWAFSSVLVAMLTWFFWAGGWIDLEKPLRLIAAGMTTGLINSILVFLIIIVVRTPDVPALANTGPLSEPILEWTHSPLLSAYLENLIIEMVDKSVSLFMACLAIFAYREFFSPKRRHLLQH